MTTTGSCLCGAITWSTDAALRPVFECHCHRCRRLTGNHMAATAVRTDDLTILGDRLAWFSPADDPNVAYGFCPDCGATMFFRSGVVDGTNDLTSICVGSVDGTTHLRTTEIWFAGEAQHHVRLAADDDVTVHAGQPDRS